MQWNGQCTELFRVMIMMARIASCLRFHFVGIICEWDIIADRKKGTVLLLVTLHTVVIDGTVQCSISLRTVQYTTSDVL